MPWCLIAHLHTAKDHPNSVSNYNKTEYINDIRTEEATNKQLDMCSDGNSHLGIRIFQKDDYLNFVPISKRNTVHHCKRF